MQRMLAYCGLACDTCPIHRATLEPDAVKRRSMRAAIAREINDLYGMALGAEDIGDCDGCRMGGRLFAGCLECEIRRCAIERGVESCAFCSVYPCETLERHLAIEPGARARLEELRPTA